MNKALWTKKLLVVPAVAALTIGGFSLSGAAANAAPADLTVTSATVAGRVLTVTGTGTVGDSIELLTSTGDFAVNRNDSGGIDDTGHYSITYTIPGTATGTTNYTVEQVTGGLGLDGSVPVTATVAPAYTFGVTTPENGSTVDSRTVTFTGTGTPGQPVNVLAADGTRAAPQAIPDADGNWTTTGTFAADAATTQNLTVNELNVGADPVALTITLPAATPASQFTLTSPVSGSTVASRTVTFTGTGTPGDLVNVLAADGTRAAPQTQVAADGTWSVVGTFSSTAATTQNLSVNQFGGAQGQGNVDFTIILPAAAVTPVTPPTTPTPPTTGTGTGSGTGTPATGGASTGSTVTDPATPSLPVVSG
ncbi:hypothetical protein AX769_08235 [Frondihabitans sp. PAMC 28766]|uniref:hypothetical protein n=1 Tax=Frondihabitans sp. PAMC 28766 TaxID=1795630 RepID=UPI00078D05E3|nr:hypothetical protein [Frondihabitans sp. PAMC 28766]AMM20155.1 hypothetical protein AX769_08235 [Frondihabitans sp. PAMC 28766]